jgi:hypothetical protein
MQYWKFIIALGAYDQEARKFGGWKALNIERFKYLKL